MKDKELRKLLDQYGIINAHSDGSLMDVEAYPAFADIAMHYRTCYDNKCNDVENLKYNCKKLFNSLYKAKARIKDLEAKFDAINKHYGIEVEMSEAKWEVKEV